MNESMKKENNKEGLYSPKGKVSLGQAVPMALQHVVAMVVGCISMPMLVAGAGGISGSEQIVMIQASLLGAAIAIFLQHYPLKGLVGSGLPVMIGSGFAFLPTLSSIVGQYGIAAMLGAQVFGAAMGIIVGIFFKYIRKLFPPIVTGSVVVTIGISLYDTAVNYMAGGTGSADYGSWQNWLVAIITLAVVTGLNHFGKGFLKLSSVLIGIIVGYVVALGFGMVDFSSVLTAKWVQFPQPMHFGIKFEPSSCVAIAVLFAISSIQAIGDFSATTTGGMDRMPTDEELSGGIIGYGVSNIVCAFFSGLPTATYSQNVGIVSSTKVVAKRVFGIAAMIMLVAGIMPKIAYILLTIPSCVLGGATISVFAMISMTGIKLINNSKMNYRNTSIVGLAIALGMGVTQANAALAQLPAWVTTIFGKSPVALSTLVAVFLNLVLPKEKEE